jgi:ATP-dependent Clp protease ATP-binding subunit ClpA
MFEKFAQAARDAVFIAIDEAGRRGDRRVGTDHLLVGLLHDPEIARQVGATPDDARGVVDELDRRALAQVGLDVRSFGELAPAAGGTRLPFTPGAKVVLERTVALTRTDRARRIESRHLLLALLERQPPDPAAEVLADLGVDRRRAE